MALKWCSRNDGPPNCNLGQDSSTAKPGFALDFDLALRFKTMRLSVVMPVYNERTTLRQVVERVLAVPLGIELICVDDGSTDGSREILEQLQAEHSQIRIAL